MPRSPDASEERVARALHTAGVLTDAQLADTLTALAAATTCPTCNGTGLDPDAEGEAPCMTCQGTGQAYTVEATL